MKTKKSILRVLLASVFIGVASLAAAQQKHPEPPPVPNEAQLPEMIKHLSIELNLNETQTGKLKILHTEHFKQVKRFAWNTKSKEGLLMRIMIN